ncbi:MAG: hypothetical protein OEX81_00740 [Candidatus Pacebacteria bacterium]|nr:hypothetical protein [Candidatus Paceibacterota bacterium]
MNNQEGRGFRLEKVFKGLSIDRLKSVFTKIRGEDNEPAESFKDKGFKFGDNVFYDGVIYRVDGFAKDGIIIQRSGDSRTVLPSDIAHVSEEAFQKLVRDVARNTPPADTFEVEDTMKVLHEADRQKSGKSSPFPYKD